MLSPSQLSELLEGLRHISQMACQQILQIYQQADFQVDHKADNSPLTAADLAAHHCIVDGLHQLTPQIPILSEESSHIDWATRQSWDQYWLVDPLDGTKEFVKRNGEFTVNIALIQQHYPVMSIVSIPVQDTHYFAVQGMGAFCQRGDTAPQKIECQAHPAGSLWRITGSRSHANSQLDRLLEQLGEHELHNMGSSLKLCKVAESSADCYPRFGPTSEWDTAAAQGIVEIAGGCVSDLQGQRLGYNRKESLLNPYFLVCHPSNLDQLVSAIQAAKIQP